MIVTCENGAVFKIDNLPGGPHVIPVAFIPGGHLEGPAVVPQSFGLHGGEIMAADDINGVVYAIKSDGTVTPNVFNWTAPDWDGAEGVFVIRRIRVPTARAAPSSRRYTPVT